MIRDCADGQHIPIVNSWGARESIEAALRSSGSAVVAAVAGPTRQDQWCVVCVTHI